MNERISALLARLGADPELRARFDRAAEEVMAEAGLNAEDQAELLRQMRQETTRGRIFAASTMESGGEIDPEQLEGRIHAVEDTPEAAQADMPATWPERVYGDSADDSPLEEPSDDTGAALSDEVYGDSPDDSPRGPGN